MKEIHEKELTVLEGKKIMKFKVTIAKVVEVEATDSVAALEKARLDYQEHYGSLSYDLHYKIVPMEQK